MLPENNKFASDEKGNDEIVLFGLFFKKILKNISAVAMVTDGEGRIKYVSDMFLDFFALNPKNISGKNWIDIIVTDKKKGAAKELFLALKEDDKLLQFDIPVKHESGDENRILWTASPLANHDIEKMYFFVGAHTSAKSNKNIDRRAISETGLKIYATK